jgi:NOL1/NOP2/sun family putative RNA methylase
MPIITNTKIINRWTFFYGQRTVNSFQYLNKTGISDIIRLNYLKTNEDEFLQKMEKKGFRLEKINLPGAYKVLKNRISLGATNDFLQGYYSIQGLASQFVSLVVNPSENDVVLDMTAAPGGKTSHLATLMNNKGLIIAFDVSKRRLTAVRSNLSRCGITNVLAFHGDALELTKKFGLFDKILLDAPCSGSGSICKNPNKEWRKDQEDIERLANQQYDLIRIALKYLKIGGELTFSTCSIEPEEGEYQILSILEEFGLKISLLNLNENPHFGQDIFENEQLTFEHSNSQLYQKNKDKWLRIVPNDDYEGFFICKIKKNREID